VKQVSPYAEHVSAGIIRPVRIDSALLQQPDDSLSWRQHAGLASGIGGNRGGLATSDRFTAATWLASPVTALLVMLFVLAGLAHALVGLRSVFLDYVHTRARLVAAGLFIRAAAVLLAGASVLAILKLFLGH